MVEAANNSESAYTINAVALPPFLSQQIPCAAASQVVEKKRSTVAQRSGVRNPCQFRQAEYCINHYEDAATVSRLNAYP